MVGLNPLRPRRHGASGYSAKSFLRRRPGFSLIELMIIIVILGVLAAVAVPALMRYVRRSKTSEASDKLSLMYRGSAAYLINANTNVKRGIDGIGLPLMFPASVGPTPTDPCCTLPGGQCLTDPVEWDHGTWIALDFSIADPHWFNYSYLAAGEGVGAQFTARANGDLDCDGIESTFERSGIITRSLDVKSGRGIYREMPLE